MAVLVQDFAGQLEATGAQIKELTVQRGQVQLSNHNVAKLKARIV